MIPKKILILLGSLVVIGLGMYQPKVITQMEDNTGMLLQKSKTSKLKELELKIVYLLNEKNWINEASVSLNYVNKDNGNLSVTLIVNGTDLKNKRNEIISIVNDVIIKSNLDIENIFIFDEQGNEIN